MEAAKIERLQAYDGEDQITTSHEMQIRLMAEKAAEYINVKSGITGIDLACEGFRDGELITISGPTKNGKCTGFNTPVLMHDGSTKMVQDVIPGDLLMGDDSKPRRVIATNMGYGEMYRITDKYGESFTANGDHILCLQRTRRTNRKPDHLAGSIYEVTVDEYLTLSKAMKHILKAYRVPVEFPEREVLIPPYIMGLWLGDGHSNGPEFTTADPEIVNELQQYAEANDYQITKKLQEGNKSSVYRICDENGKHGKTGGKAKNNFKECLKHYDLLGKKRIPQDYKSNSRENRLQLLAGLIDADGNTRRTGTLGSGLELVSKSQCLAEDVVWLCRSLGFSASCKATVRAIKSIGFEGTYYRVNINGPKEQIPCRLSRKLHGSYQHKKNILRSRFTVEPIGKDKYYGFEIDGNGRYLLGNFTVTHNTLLAQTFTYNFSRQGQPPLWFSFEVPARQFLSQFSDLPLIYMPGKLKARAMDWFEDRVYESFAKFNTRIIFIDHLHFLVDMAKQGQMSIEIGTIIRKLKTMAVEGNFVIFLLCHTKMGRHDGTLSYESIRDSSFISQESDSVIMVQRKPDIADNAARARIEFHRRTGVMERVVELVKIGNYLKERAIGREESR